VKFDANHYKPEQTYKKTSCHDVGLSIPFWHVVQNIEIASLYKCHRKTFTVATVLHNRIVQDEKLRPTGLTKYKNRTKYISYNSTA